MKPKKPKRKTKSRKNKVKYLDENGKRKTATILELSLKLK